MIDHLVSASAEAVARDMDTIFETNMMDGTLRVVGSILIYVLVFGILF